MWRHRPSVSLSIFTVLLLEWMNIAVASVPTPHSSTTPALDLTTAAPSSITTPALNLTTAASTTTPVNDGPVFNFGNGSCGTNETHAIVFTVNGEAIKVFPSSVTLRGKDSIYLSNASIDVSNLRDGKNETIKFDMTLANMYGIDVTSSWSSSVTELRISLVGNSTVANYHNLLLSASYIINNVTDPTLGLRNLSATVTDNNNAKSNTVTVNITVEEGNDPPKINLGVGYGQKDSIVFSEQQPQFVSIVTFPFRFKLMDDDSEMISMATISLISSPDGYLDEGEYIFLASSNINSIKLKATGQAITLTGSASFDDYAQVIASVKYFSLSDEPTLYVDDTFTEVQRFINVTVWDNSLTTLSTCQQLPSAAASATVTLTIKLMNDNKPQLRLTTVPSSCSLPPKSLRKRSVVLDRYTSKRLIARQLNKPKAPPPVVSVSGFGPTKDEFRSNSIITVKFGQNISQVPVSQPQDLRRVVDFTPSILSTLTYLGFWRDSKTLIIVFPDVSSDDLQFINPNRIQITFKEPEGPCDQFDVCQHYICHEEGLSCSVTGSYDVLNSDDAESVQSTDLKTYWMLMIVGLLLTFIIAIAVVTGKSRQRKRQDVESIGNERSSKVKSSTHVQEVRQTGLLAFDVHRQLLAVDSGIDSTSASKPEVVEIGESNTMLSDLADKDEGLPDDSAEIKLDVEVVKPDAKDVEQC